MEGYDNGNRYFSVSHSDPVVLEINRLQDLVKEKERELASANGEIKGLRATEVSKDKAIEELRNRVNKLDKKLSAAENLIEQENLEIKKLANERKDALAAQYAAEATLRRVYADQNDDDFFPIHSIIAPLEAEIRMYKNEAAALHEDKKALERLMKSKEAALVEAEKILKSALERALIVEEVQNQNYELKRQIEICQEENKILEKTNRQKVLEVEKFNQTIQELEEAILAGGAAANTIRDYQRQIAELNEEKRTLERELSRAKVSANRVATMVANEWKSDTDKVMPVKQWLEERRVLQAEMQRLKDKLAVAERTAKAEAQLKEKLKLRLKTIEEGLKSSKSVSIRSNAFCGSPRTEKASNIFGFLTSNGGLKKKTTSQPSPKAELQKTHLVGDRKRENMFRISMRSSKSKVVDSNGKENREVKDNTDSNMEKLKNDGAIISSETDNIQDVPNTETDRAEGNEMVSGFLYDRLQKEVINLRKACETKNSSLTAKDQEIQMLMKKVDALTKAIELESKKVKREVASKEKEPVSLKMNKAKKRVSALHDK